MVRDIREAIIQSNLIEGIDDEQAVEDSLIAWKFLDDTDILTLPDIKFIHWLVTHNQMDIGLRGRFRYENKHNVAVGNWIAPDWGQVYYLLTEWLKTVMFLDAKQSHIQFEIIHPFVDGNGRVGRLIYYWQDHKAPTIMDKDKQEYYQWFK